MDDAYFEKLYKDTTSLYRLDQLQTRQSKNDAGDSLGKLPSTAVKLIAALICAWVLIGAYSLYEWLKKKRVKKS